MSEVEQPRIPALALPHLEDSSAASLEPQDLRDAERITGARLTRLDATRATIRRCALHLTGVGELTLDHGRLIDSRLTEPEITTLAAPESTWRGVEVSAGRIGAVETSAAHWDGVSATDTRVGYLDLRDATLVDVRLAGCRVDTLDLSGAKVTRLSLSGCAIGELLVRHATLTDVDLRGAELSGVDEAAALAGAVITPAQLIDLAPLLANALGIRVQQAD